MMLEFGGRGQGGVDARVVLMKVDSGDTEGWWDGICRHGPRCEYL